MMVPATKPQAASQLDTAAAGSSKERAAAAEDSVEIVGEIGVADAPAAPSSSKVKNSTAAQKQEKKRKGSKAKLPVPPQAAPSAPQPAGGEHVAPRFGSNAAPPAVKGSEVTAEGPAVAADGSEAKRKHKLERKQKKGNQLQAAQQQQQQLSVEREGEGDSVPSAPRGSMTPQTPARGTLTADALVEATPEQRKRKRDAKETGRGEGPTNAKNAAPSRPSRQPKSSKKSRVLEEAFGGACQPFDFCAMLRECSIDAMSQAYSCQRRACSGVIAFALLCTSRNSAR